MAVWPSREEGETRKKKHLRTLFSFSNLRLPNNGVPDWSICARCVICFVRSTTNTSDASHAMADPGHQDAPIVSEKLKLLKISSLKAEQKQAVVGVLNIQTLDSGSAVGVLVFLRMLKISIYASSVVESRSH